MEAKKVENFDISKYQFKNPKLPNTKILFLSDLHSDVYPEIKEIINKERDIEYIFIAGDMFDKDEESGKDSWNELLFELKQISSRIPIYCSLGNHEVDYSSIEYIRKRLKENEICLLNDEYVQIKDMYVYGFTPPETKSIKAYPLKNFPDPLDRDCTIVLCHRPTDYEKYIEGLCPWLTLSGHAHGGQWRFFNRGVYAPDQGIFPKLTSGLHFKKRLLISRGLGNKCSYPRINNNPEAVIIKIN